MALVFLTCQCDPNCKLYLQPDLCQKILEPVLIEVRSIIQENDVRVQAGQLDLEQAARERREEMMRLVVQFALAERMRALQLGDRWDMTLTLTLFKQWLVQQSVNRRVLLSAQY